MNQPLIIVHQEDPHTGVLTLNRPAKRNALCIELVETFIAEFEKASKKPDQRVIIIKGEGPIFCAGLDLEEAMDPAKNTLLINLLKKALVMLYQCPLATIAAVHGAALAGGAGLMCACDFAIAETTAVFGLPETRRGLVAAIIMPFLCRQLKQRDLLNLLLTGALIDAKKAKEIGLINEIAATHEELIQASKKIAENVVQGAPKATALSKSFLQEMTSPNLLQDLDRAIKVHEEVKKTGEVLEGISAFLEKRPPRWAQSDKS